MFFSSIRFQVLSVIIGFALLAHGPSAFAKTPRDVYAEVDLLVQDIKALRAKNNISKQSRTPGVQIAKTPLHVYTKGLEVLDKVNRYRKTQGLPISTEIDLPQQKVVPAMVFDLVVAIRKTVANSSNISQQQSMADIPLGITPSDVYEHMWYASYLMDGLAGAIKPNLVYRNVQRIDLALDKLANKMAINLNKLEETVPVGKKPIDVNIEAYKALFKIVLLEKKLDVPPLRVPSFPAGNITPSDVYDTTNNIIAELVRIGIKVNLGPFPEANVPTQPISPNNVYAKVLVISNSLDQLIK